jgi:exodeoxyribonuclease V beta subunit
MREPIHQPMPQPAPQAPNTSPFDANRFPLEPGLRLLEASAGTGKTFALAQLVLRYLSEAELRLQQLLVVTFTDAAAAELRDRIGRRLQAALAGLENPAAEAPDPVLADWLEQQRPRSDSLRARLLLALEELDSADITTIHGFCRRTLQRQALEAAQPPGLQLESDSSLLVQQIAHDYWQQQVLALPPSLLAGLQAGISGPSDLAALLQRLDGDPALQIEPLPTDLDVEQPLAPQLEARWSAAWRELRQQFANRGQVLEQAFRSCAQQWRAGGAKGSKVYTPKPSKDRVAVFSAWLEGQPSSGDYGAVMAKAGAAELLHSYFHPGAFLKEARPWEGAEEPSLPERPLLEAVAAVVDGPVEALLLHAAHWGRRELRQRRQRSGRLGFSQLLEGLDPGEQPSSPLLEAVARRYAVALIDEFQDTDPIQWRILSRAFRPESHRLVIVGDPKQAIYRFRGGELATYLSARRAAASAGGVSALTANFRSAAPLIAALNALMRPGLRRSGLEVPAVEPMASCEALDLEGDGRALELLWLGRRPPAAAPWSGCCRCGSPPTPPGCWSGARPRASARTTSACW